MGFIGGTAAFVVRGVDHQHPIGSLIQSKRSAAVACFIHFMLALMHARPEPGFIGLMDIRDLIEPGPQLGVPESGFILYHRASPIPGCPFSLMPTAAASAVSLSASNARSPFRRQRVMRSA